MTQTNAAAPLGADEGPSADGRAGAPAPAAAPRAGRTPWPVYAAAAVAALLHALPFLRTRLAAPLPGRAWLGVPYIPKDWLQYLALVGEEPRAGQLLLANPFTTEPHDGRFVLLFFQALNWLYRATGIDPGWLLELSRAALIGVFAVALFRFLEGFYESRRARVWAVVLVLLSGGLDFVARFSARWLQPELAEVVRQDLWTVYGWTTFQAFYNPLWIAGLLLVIAGVRLLLQPGGPASPREVVQAAAVLLALCFVHPHSAVAMGAIVCAALGGEWILSGRPAPERVVRLALAVLPALAAAALVTAWQLGDPVFRRNTGGVLGTQATSVFWYPIVWAAVAVFAVRGGGEWIAGRHPWRFAVGGWFAGIALLHASPVLNGYHYVMYAFVPVALFAAGPVAAAFERLRAGGAPGKAGAVALAGLLFASTAATAAHAFTEVEQFQITRDEESALLSLAASPPGNVLCEAALGNAVPAYGPHRVYVGHWFLTPEFAARAERVAFALAVPSGEVRRIVDAERIDYVVARAAVAPRLVAVLEGLAPRVELHGELALVRLTRP